MTQTSVVLKICTVVSRNSAAVSSGENQNKLQKFDMVIVKEAKYCKCQTRENKELPNLTTMTFSGVCTRQTRYHPPAHIISGCLMNFHRQWQRKLFASTVHEERIKSSQNVTELIEHCNTFTTPKGQCGRTETEVHEE